MIPEGQTSATFVLQTGNTDTPTAVAVSGTLQPVCHIPAGQTSAGFAVQVGSVLAPTPVLLTAAYGGSSQSATVTVAPPSRRTH